VRAQDSERKRNPAIAVTGSPWGTPNHALSPAHPAVVSPPSSVSTSPVMKLESAFDAKKT
jgi:hypothetical protein